MELSTDTLNVETDLDPGCSSNGSCGDNHARSAYSINCAYSSMHVKYVSLRNAFIVLKNVVRNVFRRVNTRKTAGPDGTSGQVLRACTAQLALVLMDIFNLSVAQSVIPTCFKQSIIASVPRKP